MSIFKNLVESVNNWIDNYKMIRDNKTDLLMKKLGYPDYRKHILEEEFKRLQLKSQK